MKLKRLLQFYFFAEELNSALDNLTLSLAVRSGESERGAEYFFGRICEIVGKKGKLAALWGRFDGVISKMTERDRATLKDYASMRSGTGALPAERKREIHRAVVKFSRRGESVINSCGKLYRLLCCYYCLLRPK